MLLECPCSQALSFIFISIYIHLFTSLFISLLEIMSSYQHLKFFSSTTGFIFFFPPFPNLLFPPTVRKLVPIFLDIFTYLINPPPCDQFPTVATTLSPQKFPLTLPGFWQLWLLPQLWMFFSSYWALISDARLLLLLPSCMHSYLGISNPLGLLYLPLGYILQPGKDIYHTQPHCLLLELNFLRRELKGRGKKQRKRNLKILKISHVTHYQNFLHYIVLNLFVLKKYPLTFWDLRDKYCFWASFCRLWGLGLLSLLCLSEIFGFQTVSSIALSFVNLYPGSSGRIGWGEYSSSDLPCFPSCLKENKYVYNCFMYQISK